MICCSVLGRDLSASDTASADRPDLSPGPNDVVGSTSLNPRVPEQKLNLKTPRNTRLQCSLHLLFRKRLKFTCFLCNGDRHYLCLCPIFNQTPTLSRQLDFALTASATGYRTKECRSSSHCKKCGKSYHTTTPHKDYGSYSC